MPVKHEDAPVLLRTAVPIVTVASKGPFTFAFALHYIKATVTRPCEVEIDQELKQLKQLELRGADSIFRD